MLWSEENPDGTKVREERDANNVVTKRFFNEGEQIVATSLKFYFTRDHLGSVREMTGNQGITRAQYDYDPYGRRTKITGDQEADFGFTGLYCHTPSGLHLALYRAYDADVGRWINRDPIEERGGLNIYGYVGNDPIMFIDPAGLIRWSMFFSGVGSIAGGVVLIVVSAGAAVAPPVAVIGGFTGGTMVAGGLTTLAASLNDKVTPEQEEHEKHIPKNFCGTFSLPFGPHVSKTMESAEDILRLGQAASEINHMTDLMNQTEKVVDGTEASLHLLHHWAEVSEDVMATYEGSDDTSEE